MIIGLTGKNGCGKGTVAEFLIKHGFSYHSLSDVIRDEIRKTGHPITRERMIEVGRKLRQEGGPGVLAELILSKITNEDRVIVDSIRNPGEVGVLRRRKDFKLIDVEADQKVRFERCCRRARESDPTTLEEFIRLENEELSSTNPAGQQLVATAKLADVVVQNNGTVEELEAAIEKLI